MTTREFLIKKNKIVKKVTGITLVPEDQIEDIYPVFLEAYEGTSTLVADLCPYCVAYPVCDDCPMYIAGNSCENDDSTWNQANNIWVTTTKGNKKLLKLINKYNVKELK